MEILVIAWAAEGLASHGQAALQELLEKAHRAEHQADFARSADKSASRYRPDLEEASIQGWYDENNPRGAGEQLGQSQLERVFFPGRRFKQQELDREKVAVIDVSADIFAAEGAINTTAVQQSGRGDGGAGVFKQT